MLNQSVFFMIMAILGGLGVLVSVSTGLVAGTRFPAAVLRPLVSGICMAALGAGIYFVLEWQTPDLLRLNRKDKDEEDLDIDLPSDEGSSEDASPGKAADSDQPIEAASGAAFTADHEYDEHILGRQNKIKKHSSSEGQLVVEGVPLENKPKLMAEAIKHLLEQDKD